MTVTQITAAKQGVILLRDAVPSLAVGRQVVATVLSAPKDGMVLVSMFGRRILVETTLELFEGQVLRLRVHELEPRVVMKPEAAPASARAAQEDVEALVARLAGRFPQAEVRSFDLREIVKTLLREGKDDPKVIWQAKTLIEEFARLAGLPAAFFLVPVVDDQGRSKARISAEKTDDGYRLHFDVETDALGIVECTALRNRAGIHVEISSAHQEVVSLMKAHLHELASALGDMGVTTLEVVRRAHAVREPTVDMLV
ncbi:MAG TPA: hypothetical protein PLS81_00015 [Deltaproteobacteria bacterium]|nr:hypothetical protein [Deltaproteobacteria bacterium]HOM27826.1 hypothetical protein [Deltaproteobacteria bacterium]HPP81598.1 hypothetical protein [Deltaproteobacteria bacterium]